MAGASWLIYSSGMNQIQDEVLPFRSICLSFAMASSLCLMALDAFADSLRCGQKVVRTGDSSGLLLQKCGQPLSKDRAVEEVKLAEGRKEVRVERWHYQKNKRSLSRAVWIYQGKIVGIETGGR